MASFAFDIYAATAPNGARLVRLTPSKAVSLAFRLPEIGFGMNDGQIVIHSAHADATAANFAKHNLVKVVAIRDDLSETKVGGFFLEEGDFTALSTDEQGGRLLKFSGPNTLQYLERAILREQGYTAASIPWPTRRGGIDVYGMWTWGQDADGREPGPIMVRVLEEGRDQPGAPLGHATWDFTRSVDSAGTSWDALGDEWQVPWGTTALDMAILFIRSGEFFFRWTADLEYSAYKVDPGITRTSSTFATGKVLFKAGENIVTEVHRGIDAAQDVSSVLVTGGEYETAFVTGGTSSVPWIRHVNAEEATAAARLTKIGQRELDARATRVDAAFPLTHIVSDDELNGGYIPFIHYAPGDIITIHTGTDAHDFNNFAINVAAVRIVHDEAGNWFGMPELGAQTVEFGSRSFEERSNRLLERPNPELCRKSMAIETSTDWKVLQLQHWDAAGNTVVVNAEPANWKSVGFDDSGWPSALASAVQQDTTVTEVTHADVRYRRDEMILRREVYIAADDLTGADAELRFHADDGGTVWVNGVQVATHGTKWDGTAGTTVTTVARSAFSAGLNCVAIYIWNQEHGTHGSTPNPGGVDAGLRIAIPNATHNLGTSIRAKRCDDVMHAALVPISDLGGHFGSGNVEGALQELGAGGGASDEKAKVSANDTTAGYLNGKLVAGTNVTLTEGNDGGDETLTIAATAGGSASTATELLTPIPFPIFAHHGDLNATDGYPENTAEAFRQGMTRGAHGIEMDVLRSADGTFHAHHDLTVDRTTNGTGTFASKTDAQIAALNIDGGNGYNAGRHGTSLKVPTTDAVLDVVIGYDPVILWDLKEDVSGVIPGSGHAAGATALANYIITKGVENRSIIILYSLAAAAAVKAVTTSIPVALLSFTDFDVENDADVDRLYARHSDVPNAAFVIAREPKPVDSWPGSELFGTDELSVMTDMWQRGARSWTTNDVGEAMTYRNQILGLGTSAAPTAEQVRSVGRWEPVTNGVNVFVWDGDEIVVHFVETP